MRVHTIYKITNTINGKFYIGKHSTEDPNDDYYGSGRTINKSIQKYGKKNFKKEILFIFDNEDDALKKEAEIVNEDLINDPKCYNETIGGRGTFRHCITEKCIEKARKTKQKLLAEGKLWKKPRKKAEKINRDYLTKEYREKCRERMVGEKNPMYGKEVSSETRAKISRAVKGRSHSEESKRKMSEAKKGYVMSAETKAKLSKANKGRKDSLETRERKRKSHLGKKLSAETIKKVSSKNRGKRRSEKTKKILSEHAKKRVGDKNPNYRELSKRDLEIIKKNIDKSINGILKIFKELKIQISRRRIIRGVEAVKALISVK